MDAAPLPNDAEAARIRAESAQRVSGDGLHWDEQAVMDPTTHYALSFAGVNCRVIGTFFLDERTNQISSEPLILRFGSDLSNYYPNRGLKVYKPNAEALRKIVNYRDPDRVDALSQHDVTIGEIRYASTNRSYQGTADVSFEIVPVDLLSQKSALFGMTRTGKSNTTKIILKSVFNLRHHRSNPVRVGQIVFDPHGEYANENVQDQNDERVPTAVKNVWASNPGGDPSDVVTYGIVGHPNDPGRKLMLLNFVEDDNLQVGKEIIDMALADDGAKFIQSFIQVVFEPPAPEDRSAQTRYARRVLVYRALLAKAGFRPPANLVPATSGLFSKELRDALQKSEGTNSTEHQSAAKTLGDPGSTWDQIAMALGFLGDFMRDSDSGYKTFDQWYINRPNGSGDPWADEDLKKLLEMFRYPNGVRQLGKVVSQHTPSTSVDYVVEIYQHLSQGRLVIVDQSSGDSKINQTSADRILRHLFRQNQEKFRAAKTPPEILVYVEEAHNLLPYGSDQDLQNIWVRTAKEGAKLRLGMVYATQEVSSIQRNILKNTANWFIGHLNNTDETRELCKYYDFADFEASIRRAQDRGFLRVKTLSNMFVVPIQVRKFEV